MMRFRYASIDELAQEGASYSTAVARLVETGARTLRPDWRPRYVASGEGPEDPGRA